MNIWKIIKTDLSLATAVLAMLVTVSVMATQLGDLNQSKYLFGSVIASAIGAAIAYAAIRMRMILARPSIYISYASPDKSFAHFLAGNLSDLPVRVLIDEHEILVGENYLERCAELIEESAYICIVISKHYEDSQFTNNELKAAIESNAKILPAVIDDSELPAELAGVKFADFRKNEESGLKELRRAIKADIAT